MKLTELLQDVGRPVAYYPAMRKITGSAEATLLLCQLIYWCGKQNDPGDWVYKTADDIEEETGLTYDEQRLARNKLASRGLIEFKQVFKSKGQSESFPDLYRVVSSNLVKGGEDG